jgi:hypothetical protein
MKRSTSGYPHPTTQIIMPTARDAQLPSNPLSLLGSDLSMHARQASHETGCNTKQSRSSNPPYLRYYTHPPSGTIKRSLRQVKVKYLTIRWLPYVFCPPPPLLSSPIPSISQLPFTRLQVPCRPSPLFWMTPANSILPELLPSLQIPPAPICRNSCLDFLSNKCTELPTWSHTTKTITITTPLVKPLFYRETPVYQSSTPVSSIPAVTFKLELLITPCSLKLCVFSSCLHHGRWRLRVNCFTMGLAADSLLQLQEVGWLAP